MTGPPNGQVTAAARLRSALVTVRREAKRWGYVDRDPSLAATTLLAGSGRSGTTWVEEVIDRHHDHRVLFEPLRASEEPSIAGMPHGLYLRPDDPAPDWRGPVENILRGRVRNRWTDHQNHVLVARRRLVKEIRANPLLPWLATQFPDVRLVWLVRHPLAVAASARSLGWQTHLDELVGQPDLVADHLEPLLPVLEAVDGPIERFVAQWCIENLVPFRMLEPSQVHLVFYEELVDRPVEVAADLLRAIGQVPDDAVRTAVERPSKLARVESAVVQGGDLLTGWQRSLGPEEITAAADLVDALGLGGVYGRDPRPDADAGRALLAAPWPASTPDDPTG